MGISVEGQVGPRYVQDGANTELRQGRSGALVVTDAHGKYHETTMRGNVYSVTTATAGTTIVAGNVSPPAAAAATILSIYNPITSGVNASILKVFIASVSGTPGAGAFTYCISTPTTAVTAAQNASPTNNFSGVVGASKCRGFTQTALTGGSVHTVLRTTGYLPFAGAIAATSPGLMYMEYVEGSIIIPPGSILSIAPAAAGTTHIVTAAIEFEEVPV